MILHDFSLLMSAFSLQRSSFFLSKKLYWCLNVPLPNSFIFFYTKKSRFFGEFLEPRSIFGEKKLDQWAVTLSFKDGCFQAHLLVVFAFFHPFPLKNYLRTLENDLGCFPLNFGSSHPKFVYNDFIMNFLSSFRYLEFPFLRLGFGPPLKIECSTP